MAEVCAGGADSFAVREASHVLPDHLLVAERGPAVGAALLDKLIDRSALGSNKQGLTSDTVIVGHLGPSISLDRLQPRPRSPKSVTRVLRVVPIKVTYLISSLEVAPVEQVVLHRCLTCSVRLL